MLINEAAKETNLTKKAIAYYVEQGLISPHLLENGYRDFSNYDVDCLKKISVLRKLEICTEEIKLVLTDQTGDALQKLSIQKEFHMQQQQFKKVLLDKLRCGTSYESIAVELKAIDQNATITEKLLEAFPGYYGKFVCLHFARFLNEPILTVEQQSAYEKIISFLDNLPPLNLPNDLQDYLMETTQHLSTQHITDVLASVKQSIENPEDFLLKNKDTLDEYLAYKQSEAYKNSPVCKLQSLLMEFNQTSGYYDVFIPMIKILSPAYANYYSELENANEKFIAQYPVIATLNS